MRVLVLLLDGAQDTADEEVDARGYRFVLAGARGAEGAVEGRHHRAEVVAQVLVSDVVHADRILR